MKFMDCAGGIQIISRNVVGTGYSVPLSGLFVAAILCRTPAQPTALGYLTPVIGSLEPTVAGA